MKIEEDEGLNENWGKGLAGENKIGWGTEMKIMKNKRTNRSQPKTAARPKEQTDSHCVTCFRRFLNLLRVRVGLFPFRNLLRFPATTFAIHFRNHGGLIRRKFCFSNLYVEIQCRWIWISSWVDCNGRSDFRIHCSKITKVSELARSFFIFWLFDCSAFLWNLWNPISIWILQIIFIRIDLCWNLAQYM